MNKFLLEQAVIEYRIKHIINTPHLKAKYLAEYKRENGSNALDEGFIDSLRDKFNSAKSTVKSAATKVSNVAQGIADIGFLGRGTTIFNGVETFDIEKRKKMLDVATQSLESELRVISKRTSEFKNYGVELAKLYDYLNNAKFPNSDSFKTDVAMIKKKYDNLVEDFNNNKIEAREANILFAVLRHLVIFYQDYKIHDGNLYLNEAVIKRDLGDGSYEEYIEGRKEGDVSASYEAAYSTKLPAALIIGGASLAALSIGADSQLFKDILDRFKDMGKATPDQISSTISSAIVNKGEGITQVMSRMSGINLGPSAKLDSLLNPQLKGILPLIRMAVEYKNPGSGGKAFDQLIQLADTNGNQTLGQALQGDFSGTGKSIGDLLDVDKGTYTEVIENIVKGKAAQPLDTLKNDFLSYMGQFGGPMLAALGFSVAAGGIASGAMRMKGKLSSRMSTLKNLVDTFKDVGSKKDKVEKLPPPQNNKAGPPPLPPETTRGPPPLPPETTRGPPPLPPETPKPPPLPPETPKPPPLPPETPKPPPLPPEKEDRDAVIQPSKPPKPPTGPESEQPVFYVRKSGGNSLRKTSLNTWLSRQLSEPMATLGITDKAARGLIKGIVQIAYDSLKSQGATIQEGRYVFDQDKSKPYLGGGVEKTSKKDNVKKVREPADNTDVDTSKAHKFSVPLVKIQKFVREYYAKNTSQQKKGDFRLIDRELADLSGEIHSLIKKWVKYQTGTSKEQLKGKKDSEERIKKAKQTLGINEGQIIRWKQLAGIIKG